MKKKSFLAVLCSAALFLQLAPAVLADDVLSDATTDEVVTTEETITDSGEFGNAIWDIKRRYFNTFLETATFQMMWMIIMSM